MKKLLAFVPMFAAVQATAADINFEKMSQQLDVMENIMKTSVLKKGKRSSNYVSGIESTYLAGQGIVFTIYSSSKRGHWGNFNVSFPAPPVPPVPPVPDAGQLEHFEAVAEAALADIDVEATVAQAMEVANKSYEQALESMHDNHELIRELRDDQRDLSYELRDLQREERDLAFQARHVEKEKKKALAEKSKVLEKEKVKLKAELSKLNEKMKVYQKKKSEEYAKQEQDRQSYYKALGMKLTDTLCLYGNGLKVLPKDEKVTVILKSGGQRVDRHYQDIIQVYNKRDINGCAIDDITSDQLHAKAEQYQF